MQKRQGMISISLAAVLGLGVGMWLLESGLAPQFVRAYTARINLSIEREASETYDSLMRRARTVARAAAQRSFDTDLLVSEVLIFVVGENKGALAPLLTLEVSRSQWRNRPDPQYWAKYYPTSKTLLGLDKTQASEAQPANPPANRQPDNPPANRQPDNKSTLVVSQSSFL
ncbi:MAG: hypothetical protein N3E45_09035 [Oscillatoriaceae bacterium SKW80]|nr:hypothetical protein [Oscillatoriaceae bacterium SKYG93]MCX8120960.1 hypothetical protein [Oscillatoriaceae bacterium SKW80]MDW8452233.1 hypothetical protein [Oscillatoriaceae cyanobacterium SKYGB_i_bin93]HIK26568.1 hypothetical protein [Oscillatoriaceae cyanobacterium M7585_C2015_266]